MFLCVSRRRTNHEEPHTSKENISTVSNAVVKSRTFLTKTNLRDNRNSFRKWSIGERLVIYLAISDMSYSVAHVIDHSYVIHTQSNSPDLECTVFAFILQEAAFSQWIIVLFTAVSACSLIVFNKKLGLGRFRLEVDPGQLTDRR